jgi:hypothetical protein
LGIVFSLGENTDDAGTGLGFLEVDAETLTLK